MGFWDWIRPKPPKPDPTPVSPPPSPSPAPTPSTPSSTITFGGGGLQSSIPTFGGKPIGGGGGSSSGSGGGSSSRGGGGGGSSSGGSYNPTTLTYTSSTGQQQSMAQAPVGAKIVGGIGTTYQGTIQPSKTASGGNISQTVPSGTISADTGERARGTLYSKGSATLYSIKQLGSNIGGTTGRIFGFGSSRDMSVQEIWGGGRNILKPFEYSSPPAGEVIIKNPYYIDSANKGTIRNTEDLGAPLDIKPYVTKQELYDKPNFDIKTEIVGDTKITTTTITPRISEDELKGRAFSAPKVSRGIGTAGIIGASIASPAVATIASMASFTKSAGRVTNPTITTKERLTNLGIAGISAVGVGWGVSRTFNKIESQMFKSEVEDIIGKQTKTLAPTKTYSLQGDKINFDFTTYKGGKSGIGSAEIDMFSTSVTGKTGANRFLISPESLTSIKGETAWRYSFGDKFLSVSRSSLTGSGIQLPTNINGKGFSFVNIEGGKSVGGFVAYKDASKISLVNFEKSIKTQPIGSSQFLTESTRLTPNLYYAKSYPLRMLDISDKGWGAITEKESQRGFIKTFKYPSDGGFGGRITTTGKPSPIFDGGALIQQTNMGFPSVSSITSTQTKVGGGFAGFSGGGVSSSLLFDTRQSTGTRQDLRVTPITTTIPKMDTDTKTKTIPSYFGGQILSTKTGQDLRVTPITTTIPKITQQTKQKTTGFPITTPTPIKPYIAKTITTPFFGVFGLPFKGERFGGLGKLKAKRSYSYFPSFKAIAFGIKGKKPKTKRFSGLETRPIGKEFGLKKIKFSKLNFKW